MSNLAEFTCTRCKVCKPISEYHKRSAIPRGHDSWCKACKSEYRKQYFNDNYEKETTRSRVKAWKVLGIDLEIEEYRRKVVEVNHRCEICGKAGQTLHVDHCHSTGKIRGLLCGSCNRALGLFQENPKIVQNALTYLNKNE